MVWNSTTVIVLIIVLFAGYGIGLLENYLKYSERLKQAEQEKRAFQAASEPKTAIPQSEPSILRLWTDPAQTLKLELDGKQIDSPQSVSPEERRRLIGLLGQIRPWLEGGSAASPAKPTVESPLAPAQAQAPSKAPANAKNSEPPIVAKPTSIVAQIDEVLQAHLIGTPLANKAIRLQESPDGSVIVWVGLKHYEGIDAISEPEIQALIRQAAAEWEKGLH